ncbi:MAG: ABC transporter substrate-binding protein [Desulfobacterales bacterium]|nr:ABC transporter substrate-binding protein [Desulfobacterales bacterium]
MNQRSKLFLIVLTVIFGLSLIAGEVTAAEKIFKLGVLAPLTGPAAKSGNEMKDAATMAIDEMGGKVGDYTIELVYIDDQSDPSKGTSAYAEAIERKGVQAGILNWNTAVTVAIQPMLAKYKVPHFFCMGAGIAGNEKWASMPPEDRYLIMKGWPIPQKLVVGYVDLLDYAEEKGIFKPEKKIAALWGEDTDWGRSLVGGLAKGLKENGWEISTEEYFDLKKTDFYPYINKCKQAGVSLMAGSSTGAASVSAIIKQAGEVGYKGLIIADGLGWVGDWYKLTGRISDGVLDMQPQLSTPNQKAWVKRFKDRFGYNPSPSAAGQSYDYALFFTKIAERAIEKYGELNSETVTKIGREEVAEGKLTFSRADGALVHARYTTDAASVPDPTIGPADFFFPIIQYKKGIGFSVFPEDTKQTELMVK